MRKEDQEAFRKVVILTLRLDKGQEFKFVKLNWEGRREGGISDRGTACSGSDSVLLQ